MKRRNRIAIFLALGVGGVLAASELPAYWKPELMGTRIVRAADLRTIDSQEGSMQVYFQAPTSTLLSLGLRRVTMEPGLNPYPARPHSQPVEMLLVVEKGVLEVQLKEDDPATERLEAGAALFLAPNQWHAIKNGGTEPVTFLEMMWTSPGMNGEPDYPENAVNWGRPRRQ
ncbi:MAG TPA: cupin domain-containing protein [Longimicrobiaceae bacterium]